MEPKHPGDGDHNRRPSVPRTPHSLRVTFGYDLDAPKCGVRLLRVERVRALAPGIATAPPRSGQSGAWFEVRDAGGRFLYYQPLHDAMPATQEVFADETGQPALRRQPRRKRTGEFQVLVPDLPNAASFAVHASIPAQPGAAAAERAAEPVVTLGFDELRRCIAHG
jgi:hypothetical protein